MGLETSEHIGKILIDPRNSNVVYVAAQGPLFSAGGERGLYKTTDGGATWNARRCTISEDTGVSDIVFDPRNPDVIYAAAYQRRRHVGQMIGGGPEGGIFKTTDGGKNWTKLTQGPAKGRRGPRRRWRSTSARTRRRCTRSSTPSGRSPASADPTMAGIVGADRAHDGGRGAGGGRGARRRPERSGAPPPAPCAPLGVAPTPPAPGEAAGRGHVVIAPAQAVEVATAEGEEDEEEAEQDPAQLGGRGNAPTDDWYRGGGAARTTTRSSSIRIGPTGSGRSTRNVERSTDGGKTWQTTSDSKARPACTSITTRRVRSVGSETTS